MTTNVQNTPGNEAGNRPTAMPNGHDRTRSLSLSVLLHLRVKLVRHTLHRMPRQRGPTFGPTGVVVLAELSAREKVRSVSLLCAW